MFRSFMLCLCLLIVSAQVSGKVRADNVTAPESGPAPTTPPGGTVQPSAAAQSSASKDSASPEAKAAAVPVDREALLSPESQPKAKHHDLESDPLFVPGAVLIGTGGAALLASLFTGLGAHGIYHSLEDDCRNDICGSDKQHRIDSGKSLAVVSTVLTGVGIAAVGVGTVFMVLAATREEKPETQPSFGIASLRLTGGPSPLGVGASGSF